MNIKNTKKYVDFTAGIVIICAFAACMFFVVLAGAGITMGITGRDSASADMRICAGYITTRIQTAERKDELFIKDSVEATGGILCIPETVDGTEYVTSIYCYEGTLRELFHPADYEPALTAGSTLINAENVSFNITGGLLTAEIDLGNGNTGRSIVCISTEKDGVND